MGIGFDPSYYVCSYFLFLESTHMSCDLTEEQDNLCKILLLTLVGDTISIDHALAFR